MYLSHWLIEVESHREGEKWGGYEKLKAAWKEVEVGGRMEWSGTQWQLIPSVLFLCRPRTSSTQSCWRTCIPVVTRIRWWRNQQSRPSDVMKCCACTMPWKRPSTSSGTSTPALSAPQCPHRWTTLGCRCRAYHLDAGTRGSGGEPHRPAWCLFSG